MCARNLNRQKGDLISRYRTKLFNYLKVYQRKMTHMQNAMASLLFFVAGALARASLPPIPSDLSTPVQQRLAFNGPNS
jgi:hypothetical protein